MNLGELIKFLEKRDQNKVVPVCFFAPHSYRGSYDCLAFAPTKHVTIGSMLAYAKEALGHTYIGWKGGDYKMEEWTPIYIANPGECGEQIGELLMTFIVGEQP